MSAVQGSGRQGGNWLRESEHVVLMVVSLVFSVGSAYAIRGFFEPLDSGDPIHYVLWWIVSAGFGLLGFYFSRSLMHRMMAKEPVWVYIPLFGVIEFFEVLCNYAKAVSVVSTGNVAWIVHAPGGQQEVMVFLTYVGWSILPLVSPLMAVVDMDMTRRRAGETAQGQKQLPVSAATKQPANNRPVVPQQNGVARPAGQSANNRPVVSQQNGVARPGGSQGNGRPVVPQQNGVARPAGQSANNRPVVPQQGRGTMRDTWVNGPPSPEEMDALNGAETLVEEMTPLKAYYAKKQAYQDRDAITMAPTMMMEQ